MNKLTLTLLAITIVLGQLIGQTTKVKYNVNSLIEPRVYELDGGNFIVTGQSRVIIKIDLPENTVEWYYVFTSYSDKQAVENKTQNINLASQLSKVIDQTGTTASALSTLLTPSGSNASNVYLFSDYENAKNFYNKSEQDLLSTINWRYNVQGSIESASQGKAKISDYISGTPYLGIKAGSSPVVVEIEVVAIVEVMQDETEEEQKAMSFGNLGWKAFERGDYDKCLEYSKKAIELDKSMAFVHFNIGLVHLIKGNSTNAVDVYTNALTICRKIDDPKNTLLGALKDIDDNLNKFPNKDDASDIKELLNDELKRYQD